MGLASRLVQGCVAAIVCCGAALLLCLILTPLTGEPSFHLFLLAVAVSGLWGLVPGLVATGISMAMSAVLLGRPLAALLDEPSMWLFLVAGVLLSVVVAAARRFSASQRAHEQAKVEDELRASANDMHAILDSALDAVVGVDQHGQVISWNPRAREIFGWSEKEAVGRSFAELVLPPTDRDAFRQGLGRLLETGEWVVLGQRREARALRRDRSHFPAEMSMVARRRGRTWRLNAFIADITERKRSEELLRHNLAFTGAITSHLGEGVLALDEDGRLTFVNPAAAAMLGWTETELMGRSVHDVVHGSGRGHTEDECPLVRAAVFGEAAQVEDEFRRREGGFPVAYTASAIDSAEPRGAVLVFHDTTERKLIESSRAQALERERAARGEAEMANRMKDEFLATLSHELRTPLTAIVGWAQVLLSGELAEADKARAIASIDRNARAQAQLISDLLDVSRVITGKLHLEMQPVAVAQVVEAAIDTVRRSAETKRVELVADLDRGVGRVSGDPHRLQQVVLNLLTNAVKFTPSGGRVRVRLARERKQVSISVQDTGAGIEPGFLPHVFERFRQADSSSARAHGGLGLGLAIVRHLVDLHGGTVHADSRGPGLGATFTVRLPVLVEPAAAALGEPSLVPPEAADAAVLDGLRVLVVDDDADSREMMQTVLARRGAHVTVAASAAAALDSLLRERPDVLISDLEMPETDGFALMREVRALPEGHALPAAALTGYARPEDRVQSLSAGYQLHLVKPIEPTDLVAAVAALAGRTAPSSVEAGS